MHSYNNPSRLSAEEIAASKAAPPVRALEVGNLYPFTVSTIGDPNGGAMKYRAVYLHAKAGATEYPLRNNYLDAQGDALFARRALTDAVENAAKRARQVQHLPDQVAA